MGERVGWNERRAERARRAVRVRERIAERRAEVSEAGREGFLRVLDWLVQARLSREKDLECARPATRKSSRAFSWLWAWRGNERAAEVSEAGREGFLGLWYALGSRPGPGRRRMVRGEIPRRVVLVFSFGETVAMKHAAGRVGVGIPMRACAPPLPVPRPLARTDRAVLGEGHGCG